MFKLFATIAVIAACLLGSTDTAHAYSWWTVPNQTPTAADKAQLPLHITLDIVDPAAGTAWLPVQNTTWTAIWPRNATGAWYRPVAYSQPNLRRSNIYSYQYYCYMNGATAFRCRDLVRGIDRYIGCPANARMNWMIKWRSKPFNAAWPEDGLFWAGGSPWEINWGKLVPVVGGSVTGNGQQINCAYGPATGSGPGTTWDMWAFRR